jgi:hypothetical protein
MLNVACDTTSTGRRGIRTASTLSNTTTATASSAEQHARRCQKWGIETCLHTLTAHTLHSTNSNDSSNSNTCAKLPALDAVLCKAGASSSDKDNELLLQLQQTLECATTIASNSSAPHADTVVQLRDELLQGFSNVQHSSSDTDDTANTSVQHR